MLKKRVKFSFMVGVSVLPSIIWKYIQATCSRHLHTKCTVSCWTPFQLTLILTPYFRRTTKLPKFQPQLTSWPNYLSYEFAWGYKLKNYLWLNEFGSDFSCSLYFIVFVIMNWIQLELCLYIIYRVSYRIMKVVFHDYPGPVHVHFPVLSMITYVQLTCLSSTI